MMQKEDFEYFDLREGRRDSDIGLLFPDWEGDQEVIAIFSPHDDDAALGAGYLILAAAANGAKTHVFIVCDGCAGYSTVEGKDSIVERRRKETIEAYAVMGIGAEDITRLDYPDFSVLPYVGWKFPDGREGSFATTIPAMRKLGVTRLLVPNGYREHIDHEASNRIASYDGPQVGDAILADWGAGEPIQTFLEYAVWGDFSPEDALTRTTGSSIRANRAILANPQAEETVAEALGKFESQQQVIADLLKIRQARRCEGGVIELFLDFDPRPALDYEPYKEYIRLIERGKVVGFGK